MRKGKRSIKELKLIKRIIWILGFWLMFCKRAKGINTIKETAYLEYQNGRKDVELNQLQLYDGKHYSSPHIIKKYRYKDEFYNKYLGTIAVRLLEPIGSLTSRLVTELKRIDNVGFPLSKEQAMRRANNNLERKTDILIVLAEIKNVVDTYHENAVHKLESIDSALDKCLANYWKGVLAASDSNTLGVFPVRIEPVELQGVKEYHLNRKKILEMISTVISDDDHMYEEGNSTGVYGNITEMNGERVAGLDR